MIKYFLRFRKIPLLEQTKPQLILDSAGCLLMFMPIKSIFINSQNAWYDYFQLKLVLFWDDWIDKNIVKGNQLQLQYETFPFKFWKWSYISITTNVQIHEFRKTIKCHRRRWFYDVKIWNTIFDWTILMSPRASV